MLGLVARAAPRQFVGGLEAHQRLQQRRAVGGEEEPLLRLIAQGGIAIQGLLDLLRDHVLGLHKRIVGRCRLALAPDLLRQVRKPAQERVAVRQQLILQPERVHPAQPLGHRLADHRLHDGLHHGAVEAEIDLRQPGHGGEAALVLRLVAAQGTDVVEVARLEAEHMVPDDKVGVRIGGLAGGDHGLVEARRQHVD